MAALRKTRESHKGHDRIAAKALTGQALVTTLASFSAAPCAQNLRASCTCSRDGRFPSTAGHNAGKRAPVAERADTRRQRIEEPVIGVELCLFAIEHRLTLVAEGIDPFPVVATVVDDATQPLYPLEQLRGDRMRARASSRSSSFITEIASGALTEILRAIWVTKSSIWSAVFM